MERGVKREAERGVKRGEEKRGVEEGWREGGNRLDPSVCDVQFSSR